MAQPLEAWQRLEAENVGAAGVFRIRMFAESPLDLFAVLELPGGRVGIQLEVPANAVSQAGGYPVASGFRTRVERFGASCRILVLLEAPAFRGVFGEMCIDVLRSCLGAGGDQARAVRGLVGRLVAWKELFSGSGPRPLGEREQTGLFGELCFLEFLLDSSMSPAAAVGSWHGPYADPHDFHLGGLHLEVKSTISAESSLAVISSLAQLDPAGLHALLLWHHRLRRESTGGRSLRALVEQLRSRLDATGLDNRRALDDRLLRARYLDVHAPDHYDLVEFVVVETRPLRVGADFPALRRADVPAPIREVTYELLLDEVPPCHEVPLEDAIAEVRAAVMATVI